MIKTKSALINLCHRLLLEASNVSLSLHIQDPKEFKKAWQGWQKIKDKLAITLSKIDKAGLKK